jgi:F0F1-type ATP synthase delta subunit
VCAPALSRLVSRTVLARARRRLAPLVLNLRLDALEQAIEQAAALARHRVSIPVTVISRRGS